LALKKEAQFPYVDAMCHTYSSDVNSTVLYLAIYGSWLTPIHFNRYLFKEI